MKSSTVEDLRAEYLRLFDNAAPALRVHLVHVVRAVCGDLDDDPDTASPQPRSRLASVPERPKPRSRR